MTEAEESVTNQTVLNHPELDGVAELLPGAHGLRGPSVPQPQPLSWQRNCRFCRSFPHSFKRGRAFLFRAALNLLLLDSSDSCRELHDAQRVFSMSSKSDGREQKIKMRMLKRRQSRHDGSSSCRKMSQATRLRTRKLTTPAYTNFSSEVFSIFPEN